MEKKRMIKIMNETTQLSATWMCLVWWFYKHIGYDSWRKWLDKTRTHTSTRTPEQTLLEYSNDEFIIKTSHIHICVGIQHMACSIDRVYIYIYILSVNYITLVCVRLRQICMVKISLFFLLSISCSSERFKLLYISLQFWSSCCYHFCFVFACHRVFSFFNFIKFAINVRS